mmetsp:Transcript_54901/g.114898  ORF Transcript_54901/g.114898 Transcript_54901/m.114898 type:complete len:209 (+) Transcript_54901:518-1144(+)
MISLLSSNRFHSILLGSEKHSPSCLRACTTWCSQSRFRTSSALSVVCTISNTVRVARYRGDSMMRLANKLPGRQNTLPSCRSTVTTPAEASGSSGPRTTSSCKPSTSASAPASSTKTKSRSCPSTSISASICSAAPPKSSPAWWGSRSTTGWRRGSSSSPSGSSSPAATSARPTPTSSSTSSCSCSSSPSPSASSPSSSGSRPSSCRG